MGAATSYATGNDITAGALAGATSEKTAPILASYLYGKDTKELTQEQKDTVSSIITLASTATTYGVTGDVSSAVSASEVGKVAFEWNGGANSLQKGRAENAKACRAGNIAACQVKTLGNILGEYANKYHDLTIYSVSLGAISYTVIVNNRNDKIWVGGIPESDSYRVGYGISTKPQNLNPTNLIKTLEENAEKGKTPRVIEWKLGISVQAGTVIGATTAEEVDNAIGGRSLGVQACNIGCLGVSKGEGQNGAVIVATGFGSAQIGVGGTVMRELTDNEKEKLKELGILK